MDCEAFFAQRSVRAFGYRTCELENGRSGSQTEPGAGGRLIDGDDRARGKGKAEWPGSRERGARPKG